MLKQLDTLVGIVAVDNRAVSKAFEATKTSFPYQIESSTTT